MLKLKARLAPALLIPLLLLAFIPYLPSVHAVAPTTVLYSLPAGSNTEALTADSTYIYYCSNSNGNIFKVNPSTGLVATITPGSYHWASCYFYRQAIFAVDSSGGMYQYNLTTSTFSQESFDNVANSAITNTLGQMLVAGQCPVGNYNFTSGLCETWNSITHTGTIVGQQRFWYTAHQIGTGARFDKIEYLKDVSNGNPAQYHDFPYDCSTNSVLCSGVGPYYGFAQDSAGDVWWTDYGGNALYEYVATQNSISRFTGFTHPAGVAVSGNTVYVAENSTGIAEFSTTTNSITTTIPTVGSYPFGVAVNGANIVWTSSGSDHKICILGVTPCANTGERNYYPLPLANGNTAFGYLGSGGVGVVSGLGTSTTTTNECKSVVVSANMGQWPTITVNGSNIINVQNAFASERFYIRMSDAPTFAIQAGCGGLSVDSASYDKLNITKAVYTVDCPTTPKQIQGCINSGTPISLKSFVHQREIIMCQTQEKQWFYSKQSDWAKCGAEANIYSVQTWSFPLSQVLSPSLCNQYHSITLYAWGQGGVGPFYLSVLVYNGLCDTGGPYFALHFPLSDVGHLEWVNASGAMVDWTPKGMLLQPFFFAHQILVPTNGTVWGMETPYTKLTVSGSTTQTFTIDANYETTQDFTVK